MLVELSSTNHDDVTMPTGDEPERADDRVVALTRTLEQATNRDADPEVIAWILDQRIDAHVSAETGRLDHHLAAALADSRRAVELTPAGTPAHSRRVLQLAAVTGQQIDGDPQAWAMSAEAILRELVGQLELGSDPDALALARTNLALALQIQSGTDDVVRLREARALCEAALTHRSPQRDVVDWSYSMINLGVIVEKLADVGEAEKLSAHELYEKIAAQADALPMQELAQAQLNLLSLQFHDLARADRANDCEPNQRRALQSTRAAASALATAREVSRTVRGRAFRMLGSLTQWLGDTEGARTALRHAIELLDGADLRQRQLAAWNLGSLETASSNWPRAADAYRVALEVTDLLVNAPIQAEGRSEAIGESSRLPRWAARAFAEIGELQEAAVTLENGRTRELRRQLRLAGPELERLRTVAPDIAARWHGALAAFTRSEGDHEMLKRQLNSARSEVRSVPGFSSFGTEATFDDIREAAQEGAPVIYVNPTPGGTMLLRVDSSGTIDYRLLPATSHDVVVQVQFGFDPWSESFPEKLTSYIMAAAGSEDDMQPGFEPPDVGPALDNLLPWIGEHIAAPIEDLLRSHCDRRPLLVLSGPLATVPLAAATFSSPARCLLDNYIVLSTPSASMHVAARGRAGVEHDVFSSLVAVADPTDDLAFTRIEVDQIQRGFKNTSIATGAAATTVWLQEHAADGEVLHLACHAYGGMLDPTRTGFVLADRALSGLEAAALDLRGTRLAVASACQTGGVGIGNHADEAASLASALLSAGAAGCVASLWCVDDLATALLMTRVYEELARMNDPPLALTEAQRWLRELTAEAEQSYLLRHPTLTRHEAARARNPESEGVQGDRGRHPYAHPRFWAAFIALGA